MEVVDVLPDIKFENVDIDEVTVIKKEVPSETDLIEDEDVNADNGIRIDEVVSHPLIINSNTPDSSNSQIKGKTKADVNPVPNTSNKQVKGNDITGVNTVLSGLKAEELVFQSLIINQAITPDSNNSQVKGKTEADENPAPDTINEQVIGNAITALSGLKAEEVVCHPLIDQAIPPDKSVKQVKGKTKSVVNPAPNTSDNQVKGNITPDNGIVTEQVGCHSIFTPDTSNTQFKRKATSKPESATCDTCHKQFSGINALHRHNIIHTNIKPYGCPYCGNAFKDLSTLKNHILTHTQERNFSCSICSKAFLRKHHMTSHVASVHFLVRAKDSRTSFLYHCEFCGLSKKRKDDLGNHIKAAHLNIRFNCKKCHRTFNWKSSLMKHYRRTCPVKKKLN